MGRDAFDGAMTGSLFRPLARCPRYHSVLLHLHNQRAPCEDQISMKLVINGNDHSVDGPITLRGLVEQLGMKADRVAIELNLAIVPRGRWVETQLADGDRLEIVHFVGGGSFPESPGRR
jgi:thiamine biosynthesis protein ThiS